MWVKPLNSVKLVEGGKFIASEGDDRGWGGEREVAGNALTPPSPAIFTILL